MINKLGWGTRDYTGPTPWLQLPSQHGQCMFSLSEYLLRMPITMEPRQPSGRGRSQFPKENKSGEVHLFFSTRFFSQLDSVSTTRKDLVCWSIMAALGKTILGCFHKRPSCCSLWKESWQWLQQWPEWRQHFKAGTTVFLALPPLVFFICSLI